MEERQMKRIIIPDSGYTVYYSEQEVAEYCQVEVHMLRRLHAVRPAGGRPPRRRSGGMRPPADRRARPAERGGGRPPRVGRGGGGQPGGSGRPLGGRPGRARPLLRSTLNSTDARLSLKTTNQRKLACSCSGF